MLGFDIRVNDIVKLKENGLKGTIVRNFTGTTCFLVKLENGKETVVDRNEIVKER